MKKVMSFLIAIAGIAAAGVGTSACSILWIDEPKMPKKLIEK